MPSLACGTFRVSEELGALQDPAIAVISLLSKSHDLSEPCRRMYDAVILEQSVLPNGVRLASILAGSLVRSIPKPP